MRNLPGLLLTLLMGGSLQLDAAVRSDRNNVAINESPSQAIMLVMEQTPAQVRMDTPQGRINLAHEGAGEATRAVLNTPELGHAWLNAAAGVIEFAFTPFSATYGALRSAKARLSVDKLAESKEAVENAMRFAAEPQFFYGLLLELTNKTVLPLQALDATKLDLAPNDLNSRILHAGVQTLELRRVDKRDKFQLHITAAAHLYESSDNRPLVQRIYQYQSGKDLFIDWSRHGAFEAVARTGFEDIARRIAADIAEHSRPRPLLLGAGYDHFGRRPQAEDRQTLLASRAGTSRQVAYICRNNSPVRRAFAVQALEQAEDGRLIPAATWSSTAFQFGELSIESSRSSEFLLQAPETKAEAMAEAQSDTAYALGGLDEDRNFVVQAGAAVAAIPLGFWEQARAMWQGVTQRQLETANAELSRATSNLIPQQKLALELARCLPVPLQSTQLLPAKFSPPAPHTGSDTILEIEILRTRLAGPEGINPRLAFEIEAQVRVLQRSDGATVACIPVCYRSRAMRYSAWARHDAHALREETNRCFGEMGEAISLELGRLAPATENTATVVARN